MSDSIWTNTLAAFRDRLAATDPIPAGVTAAAVTADFGLGLFNKVLEIASKRKSFSGDRELAEHLLHEARNQAQLLAHLADRDIAAYRQYLDARRNGESTDAAMRKAIEVPLSVARAAAAGLALCQQGAGLIHAALAPDLATAKNLLAAGARSALSTVQANLEQLAAADPFREEANAEAGELLQKLQTA